VFIVMMVGTNRPNAIPRSGSIHFVATGLEKGFDWHSERF
jgi:hypothetical protein